MLKRAFQILTGVLLGLALAIWILGRSGDGAQGEPDASYFLPDPLPAPAFTLTSHRGEAVSSKGFPGKILVVFFGYTSCPDVCPLTLTKLTRALGDLGEDGWRVQVILVTVDPARDTPERLDAYLSNFHPTFLGLTGPAEEIRQVADGFGVFFNRAGEGDDYAVDHTARTFVLDPSGRIPLTFPTTATAQEMAKGLGRLLEEWRPPAAAPGDVG